VTEQPDISRLYSGDRIHPESRLQKLRRLRLLILRDIYSRMIERRRDEIVELDKRRTDVLEKLNGLDEKGAGLW
jgi:hypothetical protein